jgi:Lrp/AsnC family leucine-responsive transcriptional regulator
MASGASNPSFSDGDLDEIDLKLLTILGNNSSITKKDLAAKVNLSPSPVFERVKKLEERGYIRKYIALIDAEKLNYGLIVFCSIRLKQHDKSVGQRFVNDIQKLDEVVECYNISGDYDFMLKIYTRDMKHYQDFVFNKLGSVSSIGSTHSTFVMSQVKHSFNIKL